MENKISDSVFYIGVIVALVLALGITWAYASGQMKEVSVLYESSINQCTTAFDNLNKEFQIEKDKPEIQCPVCEVCPKNQEPMESATTSFDWINE